MASAPGSICSVWCARLERCAKTQRAGCRGTIRPQTPARRKAPAEMGQINTGDATGEKSVLARDALDRAGPSVVERPEDAAWRLSRSATRRVGLGRGVANTARNLSRHMMWISTSYD